MVGIMLSTLFWRDSGISRLMKTPHTLRSRYRGSNLQCTAVYGITSSAKTSTRSIISVTN